MKYLSAIGAILVSIATIIKVLTEMSLKKEVLDANRSAQKKSFIKRLRKAVAARRESEKDAESLATGDTSVERADGMLDILAENDGFRRD